MTRQSGNKKLCVITDNRGVVLAVVLVILLACIIVGIMIARSAFFTNKVIVNEKKYKETFYASDAAAAYVSSDFNNVLKNLTGSNALMYPSLSTYRTIQLPDLQITDMSPGITIDNLVTARLYLINIGTPPMGSRMGVAKMDAYYYKLDVYDKTYNQIRISTGLWKTFPKQ